MLIVRGIVGDVELTGTLYEPGERPPPFKGAPDEDAPYVWVCDEFYEVQNEKLNTESDLQTAC